MNPPRNVISEVVGSTLRCRSAIAALMGFLVDHFAVGEDEVYFKQ